MKAIKSQYQSSIPFNVPVNEVAHVNVDNLGFVLTLRSEVGQSHSKREAAALAAAHVSSERDGLPLDAAKPKKVGECLNSQCLQRLKILFSEEMERVQLLQHLDLLNDSLIKATEHLRTLDGDYALAAALQEKLLAQLTSLDVDYSQAKDKLSEANKEQRSLEEEIAEANAILRDGAKVKEVEVKKARSHRKHNGIFVSCSALMSFISCQLAAEKKNEMQFFLFDFFLCTLFYYCQPYWHLSLVLGVRVQGLQSTGRPVWSCCLRGDEDGEGCIEEHSVGLRSELGATKSTLNSNRILPRGGHPLALCTHSTMSMEHGPRIAFWSTKHDVYSSRIGNAAELAGRPSSSNATHLPHSRQHQLSQESTFGSPLVVGSERYPSQSTLSAGRKHVHVHEDSEEVGFGRGREFSSGLLWAAHRPPSRGVGKVRIEHGVMKKQNRPMTSPGGFAMRR